MGMWRGVRLGPSEEIHLRIVVQRIKFLHTKVIVVDKAVVLSYLAIHLFLIENATAHTVKVHRDNRIATLPTHRAVLCVISHTHSNLNNRFSRMNNIMLHHLPYLSQALFKQAILLTKLPHCQPLFIFLLHTRQFSRPFTNCSTLRFALFLTSR